MRGLPVLQNKGVKKNLLLACLEFLQIFDMTYFQCNIVTKHVLLNQASVQSHEYTFFSEPESTIFMSTKTNHAIHIWVATYCYYVCLLSQISNGSLRLFMGCFQYLHCRAATVADSEGHFFASIYTNVSIDFLAHFMYQYRISSKYYQR